MWGVIATVAAAAVIFAVIRDDTHREGEGSRSSPSSPATAPISVPAQPAHTVIYAVYGAANYTLRTDDGGIVQGTTDLPLTFTRFNSGDFVYLSVQNSEEYGSVSCRIIIDGVEVANNTSSGGYVIATCQGTVP